MIEISEAAASEALKRAGFEQKQKNIQSVVRRFGGFGTLYKLAEAIQELWDACPEKKPIDNNFLAMRAALAASRRLSNFYPWVENAIEGLYDTEVRVMLEAYDIKLAELEHS